MDVNKSRPKLVIVTKLDSRDDLDERLNACADILRNVSRGLAEREANDALLAYVLKGTTQHDEIQLGLMYNVLTDASLASKSYRDLTLTSRDCLNKVLTTTNQVIYEKWTKLGDDTKKQLLWFVRELVRSNASGADSVVHMLLRQMAGGDVSNKNIMLTESLLDILFESKVWLERYVPLYQVAVYSFLRVIVDHSGSTLLGLRQREVEFCVTLLREKWDFCVAIGRDLLRLLQDVARIPEFTTIWRDILTAPEKLSPNFTGILQILQTRTSKRFFISRLTPDMENKLAFLTSKVKFGQQKRYQDWFQKQYLSTAESQTLRCDLIRYICAVIHPSNEVLMSDVIPRWAVIGWLLTTCTTNVIASNAKLALFYDWMCFDPQKDSIMNIEPCVLVMYHSIRPHPAITVTLLDFMCRITPNFYPPLTEEIKKGVFTSLRTILDKKVLPSLAPLFDNAKLDKELRAMIKEHFSEFCASDFNVDLPTSKTEKAPKEEVEQENYLPTNNVHSSAQFSDDEEELTIHIKPTKVVEPSLVFRPIKERRVQPTQGVDISEHVERLDGIIKSGVQDLQQETGSVERQCDMMDRLMGQVLENDLDQSTATVLAQCLVKLLASNFDSEMFPQQADEESLEDSISTPLCIIFRTLCQMTNEDPLRQPVLLLLEEMYNKQPKVGYFFLYFLKVSKTQTEGKMGPYKELVKSMERSLQECLMTDLKLCQEHDVRLFTYLVPDIYNQFSTISIGNADLLHLIVSCIDGTQLQDLICEILQGHLTMFKKDSFTAILNASLGWETIEQFFLWQLISAHSLPVEHILPILPSLEFSAHSEALSSVMILLKLEIPSVELLRPLLCRQCKRNDMFTVSVLKSWAQESEEKLAEILHMFITKQGSQSTPNKKRHHKQISGKGKDYPSIEQILGHLEQLRATCKNISFLQNDLIQQALQHVQSTSSDSFKTRFSDLLALAEDLDDMPSSRVLRSVPSRRAASAAVNKYNSKNSSNRLNDDNSESSSTLSEDEEISRPKRKRSKQTNISDDDD